MSKNVCRECGGRTGLRAIEGEGVCSDCLALIVVKRDELGSEQWKQWPTDLKKADHWLIVGSSPSMPAFLEHLVKNQAWDLNSPDLVVATCNAGLYELIRYQCWSDYYGVMEQDSPKFYGTMYNDARDNHGTKIVTSSIAMNNIAKIDADIVLEITGWSDSHIFERGQYITGGTTGSHLIQLAVNFGAKRVDLVGMEGYLSTPSTQVVDTFDGRKGPKFGHKHTKQWYGPLMQQVVAACPDVEFHFYGELRYPIEGENVVRITEKQLQEAK